MFIALNKDTGEYVDAFRAKRENHYICPICENDLIYRNGDLVASHFAHKSLKECSDDWSYDMSEWHRNWQLKFKEMYRECVVTNGDGVKHRADIKVGRNIIEFQFSNITKHEFDKRNEFYTSMGYYVKWLFCLEDSNIDEIDERDYNKYLYSWNNRMRIFDDMYLKNKHIEIYFYLNEDEYGEYNIIKPTWHIGMSNRDSRRRSGFSRFIGEPMNEEEFLNSVCANAHKSRFLKGGSMLNPFRNTRFGTYVREFDYKPDNYF